MTPSAPQMPHNAFKSALVGARPLIGLWQGLANCYTAEICAAAGFDWLLFDGEHAPNTIPTMLSQLQAVAAYPVHPIARLPCGEPWLIKQYLDIGFQTLLIPFVETPDQAAALVRAMRYPPEGLRGMAPAMVRAARWGAIPVYADAANAQTCLLVQIETAAGLDNLEAIAAIDGVDGLFVGPADLAASLGHRGRAGAPEMLARVEEAITRIAATGKAPGIIATDQQLAGRYCELGCRFIATGTDVGLLSEGACRLVRDAGLLKPQAHT